jgi:crotonobetainyl-CoA:carnitine CoA-transferase CaiB-like acyl-CoA transferase
VSGPLAGIRVLDLTSVVMGPLATQTLGDLGADVITVDPERGETNRAMGPGPHPLLSGISMNLLRNKRSVGLDLRHPDGRAVFLRLAERADVMVTNLRPGPLGRLRLTYDDVRAVRPDIVFCQAHGWPSDDPRADDPAYDDVIQAASGVSDLFVRAGAEPSLAPTLLADKLCGLTIVSAVLAALVHRARTGEGQRVEVPMQDVTRAWVLVEHGAAAIAEPPLGPAGYPRILTVERRPRPTLDGWIHVLPYSEANYVALFVRGGRPDLAADARIGSGRARIANADSLYRDVGAVLATDTTANWLAFCRANQIPATEVARLDDLVAELPVADHPIAGPYRVIPHPVRYSATPAGGVRHHAPLPGADGRAVLAEAGIDHDTIAALAAAGVLRGGHE